MKTIKYSTALLLTLAFAFGAPQLHARAVATPRVGDMAPLVQGKDQDGKKWKLENEIGKNLVLLYFYPRDNTPGCTKEACGLRDKIVDLKALNVDVVGVSYDSAASHQKFIFKYNLNFPLIADTDGQIAAIYGAQMGGGKKMDRRVSFLIGLDGKIIHVTDSPNADVHLDEMQRAIKTATAKTAP